MATATETGLVVRSLAFAHNGHIPSKYTCEGEDINPPLEFSGIPEKTKSLALIVEDPDAPRGIFDHWIVWNIEPNEAIAEKSNVGVSGRNSFGKIGYGGPCPPSGVHRYYFKVFALDTKLNLPAGSDKKTLEQLMNDHVIGSAELMGYYQKKK